MNAGAVTAVPPVLVFRIGSLGDTVISLPAMHAIRRRHPGARIVLLTNTPVDGGLKAASSLQVLTGTGLVDDYVEYPHGSLSPRSLLAVILAIRRHGPTLCYFLMPQRSAAQAWRDRIFLKLAGIARIVGLDPSRYATRAPLPGEILWESEAARLLRAIGEDAHVLAQQDFALAISPAEAQFAREMLRRGGAGKRYLAMSIGAKVTVNDWGDDHWQCLLRELGASASGYALVAIGSQVERARSAGLLARWPGATVNLCGDLTPRQSAAVLARAQLFVGHDSGPMHLASAVGTPTVAVFSARNMPGIWFPFGNSDNIFYNNVDCRGCGLEVCVERQQRCIREIAPGTVARLARQLLDEREALDAGATAPAALLAGPA
jgi:ADP-heptose:LPS heptosyltransferase